MSKVIEFINGYQIRDKDAHMKDGFIDVTKIGVIPDGLTDCTDIIQNAINTYRKLYFPKGTYLITKILRLKQSTHIKCDPETVMLRGANISFAINGEKVIDDAVSGYNGHSDITIEGGTWDFNIDTFTVGRGAFHFGHCKNIVIKNLTILNNMGSHAFEIAGVDNCLIDNCSFIGFSKPNNDYAECIQIETCHELGFDHFGVFDYTPSKNITVSNCVFDKNHNRPDSTFFNAAVGHHGSAHGHQITNIKFINNYVNGCTYAGIRAYWWKNVVIDGNTFIDCRQAVKIDGAEDVKTTDGTRLYTTNQCENVVVNNNTFTNCVPDVWMRGKEGESDILNENAIVPPKNIVISNNKSENSSIFIYCTQGENITVKNNRVHSPRDHGIRFYGSNKITIDNNNVTNITKEAAHAISLGACKHTNIINNMTYSTFVESIHVDNSENIKIINNFCDRSLKSGIYCNNVKLSTISNNTVINTSHHGIHVLTGSNLNVESNIISATSLNAVNISDVSHGLVSGNTIKNSTATALYFTDVAYLTVTDNNVAGGGSSAVFLQDETSESGKTHSCTISRNTFSDIMNGYGMNIRSVKNLIISENEFVNVAEDANTFYPIYLQNLVTNTIIKGNIFKEPEVTSKPFLRIFGVKNNNIIVSENLIVNLADILFDATGDDTSFVHNFNNVIV